MATCESITRLVNSYRDNWSSEASTLAYQWDVVGQAGNLSLDIARSILESYSKSTLKAQCSGRRRQTGGYIQCPRCSTPWIAGFFQPRLLGFPRNVRNVKNLLKKKHLHPSKLSSVEKRKLNSFYSRQNILEITCLICKHKKRELFSVPVKEKILVKTKPKPDVTKRKKKVKEVNAGLHLPFVKTQNNTTKTCKSSSFSKKCVIPTQENKFSAHSFEDSIKLKNEESSDTLMKSKFRESTSMHRVSTPEKASKTATKRTASLYHSEPVCSTVNSLSKSTIGSRPGSRVSSRPERFNHKEMKQRHMQLSGLKNAALKDINRHNNDKNNTLSDFLNSLI